MAGTWSLPHWLRVMSEELILSLSKHTLETVLLLAAPMLGAGLVVGIRVGAALMFAPIWGYPGLPQYLRVMLVFSIAIGVSVVTPFSVQAYNNPGLVLPTEFLIGSLLSMAIRIAFAGLHMGGHMV